MANAGTNNSPPPSQSQARVCGCALLWVHFKVSRVFEVFFSLSGKKMYQFSFRDNFREVPAEGASPNGLSSLLASIHQCTLRDDKKCKIRTLL